MADAAPDLAPPRSLLSRLALLPPDRRQTILDTLPPETVAAITTDWRFIARPDQLPPSDHELIWALLGGRGAGKTRSVCEWAHDRMEAHYLREDDLPLRTLHRLSAASRSSADARDVLVEGESGLIAVAERRGHAVKYEPSKRRIVWPDLNAWATLFTAEEPDQARGPQSHSLVCEEYAAWDHTKTDDIGNNLMTNLLLGLRLGPDPRCAISTTPKRIPEIRALVERWEDPDDASVVITSAPTFANAANLAPSFISEVVSRYKGTSLYEQEILGIVLPADGTALFTDETIVVAHRFIDHQRGDDFPTLADRVVAVDPPKALDKDECGIVAVGLYDAPLPGLHAKCIGVLADRSMRGHPDEWAQAAVSLAYEIGAREIVAESNAGGEMVRTIIGNADTRGHLKIHLVPATLNKRIRAEPVAQLYEQSRIIHVVRLPELEDQMVKWHPEATRQADDRIDALAHGVTHLIPELTRRPTLVSAPSTRTFDRNRLSPEAAARMGTARRLRLVSRR